MTTCHIHTHSPVNPSLLPGDIQQSTTSSSWKVPPAQELEELSTCTRVLPGLSLVARIYPGVHGTDTRGAQSHDGLAPAARAEMAQGRCPRNASALIVGPTCADLWRPWNANFHFGKVLSLYSSRMEGI